MSMNITLATFFAPRPAHPMARSYETLLDLQRKSCEKWGIEHVVLTDLKESIKFNCFCTDLPENLMEASLTAQYNYLQHGHYDKLILCDADVVLGKDPLPIFDGTFHVGVTVHPFADSILNNGAIFVSSHKHDMIATFWADALRAFEGYSTGLKTWGGDQLALRDAFQASLDHGVRCLDGVLVRQFPCDGYNQAPDHVDDNIEAYCIHFRGSRKEWAEQWTKNFLEL